MNSPRTRTRPGAAPVGYGFRLEGGEWRQRDYEASWNDVMTDTVSPGYFRAVRTGGILPVNPLSIDRRTCKFGGNTTVSYREIYAPKLPRMHFRGNLYANACAGDPNRLWGSLPSSSIPPLGPLVQKALGKARTDAWDIGTFVAEFSKTATLITRAGKTFDKRARLIYDRVVRYRHRSRKDLLTTFSEQWLEYRYGWRQMMFDWEDAQQAVERMKSVESQLKRATVTERSNDHRNRSYLETGIYFQDGSASGPPANLLLQDEQETIVRAGVGLEGLFSEMPVMVNPIVTGYELIPYSFVWDWFFTTGEAVAAWAPFLRGEVAYAFTSVERKVTRVATAVPISYGILAVEGGGVSSMVSTVETKQRQLTQPTFHPFHFRVNLNKEKVADIVALLLLGHARRLKGLSQRR